MDRLPGSSPSQVSSQSSQSHEVKNPSDALERIAGGRKSVFGRGIHKIKKAFSHIRRGRTPQASVPAQTSLRSRSIATVKAAPPAGKPPIAAKPPHLVLEGLNRSIAKGDALTREVKDGLVAVKNQYMAAGLKIVNREIDSLKATIVSREQQQMGTEDLQSKLGKAEALVKVMESHLDDTRIAQADSEDTITFHSGKIKDLPQKLAARLVALDFKSEQRAVEEFHEEVRNIGAESGEKGIRLPQPHRPAKPAFSPKSVLDRLEVRIREEATISRDVKSDLVRMENQYLASGLKLVRTERNNLIETLAQQKELLVNTPALERQLKQADGLIWQMEQRSDDSRIRDAGSKDDMLRFLNEVRELPHTLGEQLVKLELLPDNVTLARFHDGVNEQSAQYSELKAYQAGPGAVEAEGLQSTQSYRELYDVQELHLKAAIKVSDDVAKEAGSRGDGFTHRKFTELSQELETQLNSLYRTIQHKGGSVDVSKEDQKLTKKMPEQLQEQLVNAGLDEDDVKAAFREAQVEELNGSGWVTHEKTFTAAGLTLTSKQQPACEMTGGLSDEDKQDVFRVPYKKGEGVSCMDTKNLQHATNMFRSSFQINGKEAFNGVRHGIMDPYGEKGKDLRKLGAEQKAEEAVIMALASKPEMYQQALAYAKGEGSAPRLLMTSTSLVTTGVGSKKEDKMQKQQEKALKALLGRAKGGVLELNVPAPDGGTREVKFAVKMSRFNLPVNFGGVGAFQKITSGRMTQRKMNKPAMQDLFGKDGKSGEVDFALKRIEWDMKGIREKRKTASPEEQVKLTDGLADLIVKKKHVQTLSGQIKSIYKKGGHHSQGGDTYKLPARIAILTDMMGGVPLYNCKSGKDRTGMMDAEIKFLLTRMERDGEVPEPGPLSKKDQALFDSILLNSQNHEVQKNNVRVKGYKTEYIKSIDHRIGDPVVREQVRGLSKAVGS